MLLGDYGYCNGVMAWCSEVPLGVLVGVTNIAVILIILNWILNWTLDSPVAVSTYEYKLGGRVSSKVQP